MKRLNLRALVIILAMASHVAAAQPASKDEVDAAKNAIDLKTYQETQDLAVQKAVAEARRAIAEAEKAEAAAKIPATESKALSGSIDSKAFGAAGLVKAFDLATELAGEACTALAKHKATFVIYDAVVVQGVVNARLVSGEIDRITKNLQETKIFIELNAVKKADAGEKKTRSGLLAVGALTGGIKAIADLASLFKSNVTVVGTMYEDAAARSLFITGMAEQCPNNMVGLGAGYLGDLDTSHYERLKSNAVALIEARYELADAIAQVKKRSETTKDAEKARIETLAADATGILKQADAFLEALKLSDFSDKGPLFSAARFLSYESRTKGSNVLDFHLRLDGLAITKENIFVGQRLRLSGVALLWYRLHQPDGTLIYAKTLRRIAKPVEVDLRGTDATSDFWTGMK